MRYDLVVIGGGPAGEKAAAAAAFFGKKVALVERADEGPGGASVHTGTLPSKTLRETALYLNGFRRLELYRGIREMEQPKQRSAADLMCRLPQVRQTQTKQIKDNLNRHGIELVHGSGRFVDPHTFKVGERALESEFFLMATGSRPRMPPAFDFNDKDVFDSDSLLEIDRLPETLAVIGGGVIGSEYACVFAELGVNIEVIESRNRLLSFLDEDVSDAIMASMRAAGIELHLNSGVDRLERKGGYLELTLTGGKLMRADKVLISAGRLGNSGGMGLEDIGVKLDDRGSIVVDEHFKTNINSVYAAGDVIGRPGLASASMEQGRMAVAWMFDIDVPERDWTTVPFGIYTIPEACALGPTERELQERRVHYVVGKSYMRHNARGQIIGDVDGFVKLIFHRRTRRLLAVHLICERATELIHIGQAVMRLGGTIDYFLETVIAFPSLTEAYKYAAYDALGELSRGADRPPALH